LNQQETRIGTYWNPKMAIPSRKIHSGLILTAKCGPFTPLCPRTLDIQKETGFPLIYSYPILGIFPSHDIP
jgi:hypothetical protein